MTDSYEQLADQLAEDEASKLKRSLQEGSKRSPDAHANVVSLSERSGLPVDVVERNTDTVQGEMKAKEVDYDKLLSDNPAFATFLSDPNNAALVHDEVPLWQRVTDVLRAAPGGGISFIGSAIRGAGEFERSADEWFAEKVVGNRAPKVRDFLRSGIELDPTTKAMKSVGEKVSSVGEAVSPPPERSTLATDISAGLGQITSQIATMIVTGGYGGTYMLAGQGSDIQAQRADQEGATADERRNAVLAGSVVTAASEKAGLGFLMRRLPESVKATAQRKLVDVFLSGGAEALQEVVEGIGHNIVARMTYDEDANVLEVNPREPLAAGGSGALFRGIVLGALGLKNRGGGVTQVAADMEKAKSYSDRLSDLLKMAEESKLFDRHDGKARELFQSIMDGVGEGDVSLNASGFASILANTEGVDVPAVIKSLNIKEADFSDAVAGGQDIVIKAGDLASTVRANEMLANAVLMNVRPDADGMTLTEAEEALADVKQRVSEARDAASTVDDTVDPETKPADAVYEQVLSMLNSNGRFNPQTNQYYAELYRAISKVFQTEFDKQGDDFNIYRAFNALGLNITEDANPKPEMDLYLDAKLNELRARKAKDDRQEVLSFFKSGGGIRLDTPIADELKAMGITPKTNPGLFSKTGKFADIDNIPAEEFADMFGVTPQEDGNGYVDRSWLLQAISDGNLGRQTTELDQLQALLDEAQIDLAQDNTSIIQQLHQGPKLSQSGEILFQPSPPIESRAFKDWFKDSKVVDENGEPLTIYHGANRGDRIDSAEKFDASRATSGPMAFFTDSKDLASSYSTRKSDTSLEINDLADFFLVGGVPLSEVKLPATVRVNIRRRGHDVRYDEDSDTYSLGGKGESIFSEDHWQWTIRDNKGDPVKALFDVWINSGLIYGEERRFTEILKLFGAEDVVYDDPYGEAPTVFPVYASIQNPLVTSEIPSEVIDALESASESAPDPEYENGVDQWDKRSQQPNEWIERLREDVRSGKSSYAWTSVPDWVTETLRGMGYDGIFDTGGKGGGVEHRVFIPFDETQIKSVHNRGTFDPNDPRILYQSKRPEIRLTGKEISSIKSLPKLREIANEYFKKNIQGKSVVHPVLGEIKFTRDGRRKSANSFANPDKARLYPALLKIVEKGELKNSEPNTKPDKSRRGIKAYHYLETPVELDGKARVVGVTIEERANGKLFFNLNADPSKKTPSATENSENIKSRLGDEELKQDIGPADDDVNITILNETLSDGRKRGAFNPATATIRFTDLSDKSTFLHETGHFFLEWLNATADIEGAPKSIIELRDEAYAYLGLKPGEWSVDAHEKWAEGFEAYLQSGKAPSKRLRRAFAAFARWITDVYRRMRGEPLAEVDPELKSIFDRLLATEEEIATAEAETGISVSEGLLGALDPADRERVLRLAQEAHDDAVQKQYERRLAAEERKVKKWWRDELKEEKAKARAELLEGKIYRARAFLMTGEFPTGETQESMKGLKLNRDALVDDFGPGVMKSMKKLPRAVVREGGIHHDEMAELLGFETGQAMIETLLEAPGIDKAASDLANDRMKAKHGDPLNDGSLEEIAATKTAMTQRSAFLEGVGMALGKKVGKRAAKAKAIRQAVEADMASRPLSEVLTPRRYLQASIRAGNRVEKALVAGDMDAAFEEKQRQLVNYEMFRFADQMQEKVERYEKFQDRLATKAISRTVVDPEYIKHLKRFAVGIHNIEGRREVMQDAIDWANLKVSNTEEPSNILTPYDPTILDVKQRRDWTFDQMVQINDFLRSMWKEGRGLSDEEAARFKEIDANLAARTEENVKGASRTLKGRTAFGKKAIATRDSYFAAHVAADQIMREIDAYEEQGYAWSTLKGRAADMENAEIEMKERKVPELKAVFENHFTKKEIAQNNFKKVQLPEPIFEKGQPVTFLTKSELLALALNAGNDYNLDVTARGYGVDPETIMRILDSTMSKRDWDFAQAMWDYLETFWPEIKALEERVTGVAPKKVDAAPIQTRHGEYAGGYYPLVYDRDLALRTKTNLQADQMKELIGGSYGRATTKHGHIKARTNSGGQVPLLSLSVPFTHVENVIHDITHREGVLELNRILNGRDFRSAVTNKLGVAYMDQLTSWLNEIGAGQVHPHSIMDQVFRTVRVNTTVLGLGFRLSSMFVQPLGLASTYVRLGPEATNIGLKKFYSSPREAWDFISERSPFMRARLSSFDRDVRLLQSTVDPSWVDDTLARLGVTAVKRDDVARMGFTGIALLDLSVAGPTWMGAFQKGLVDFKGDEAKAIKFADAVVVEAQGGGGAKDLVGIQRGSEGQRLFTMFFSYFIRMHQLVREQTKKKSLGQISSFEYAMSLLTLYAVPAVLDGLMRGDTPDDDEAWLWWMLRRTAGYAGGTMVGMRDIIGALTSDYQYSMTPTAGTVRSLVTASGALSDGEISDWEAQQIAKSIGFVTGLPLDAPYKHLDYLFDVMKGEEDLTVQGLIFGKRNDD